MSDYSVAKEQLTVPMRLPSEVLKKGEHPIETLAKVHRQTTDSFRSLTPTEVLITNLPTVTTAELASEQAVKDFLIRQVHKDLQVKQVRFIDAL